MFGQEKIEIRIYPNGDRYEGIFRNGKFNRHGKYTFANGDEYTGGFWNGEFHRQGEMIYANGDKYVGEYKKGKFHGQGIFTYANGDKYEGEFKDGNYHNHGTILYNNGDRYYGEFKDGKYDGYGTLIYANGDKYEGEFIEGKHKNIEKSKHEAETVENQAHIYNVREKTKNDIENIRTIDNYENIRQRIFFNQHHFSNDFESGRVYNRKLIHAKYGGQERSGICTPSMVPFIFIFSGMSGMLYGYKDEWISEDTYIYTGQGQVGDMEFKRGNKAILEHRQDNKEILLFDVIGNGYVKYICKLRLVRWRYEPGYDMYYNPRRIIRFELRKVD